MQQPLTEDLIRMLQVLKQEGGTYCTGTCHHRQPGEFHCHEFGRLLNLSSQGVKNRLLKLIQMGLVERHKVQRSAGEAVCMTITAEAEELLEKLAPPPIPGGCCNSGPCGSRS
jgi:DNA-binding MarR family transcriptional regulator